MSSVPVGETVRLVSVDAGAGLRSRLAAMGLVPGVEVRMMRNSGHGPAVVEVKGTRLALGRGMALQIRAE
ncbi:MAG TPA: FeoA family protein [Planctomycetota bacterium]|nr:FeoA family protein [Planctomycetota bacterium]HRT94109.1 FeoA family protein [Planctomycetota bacterium]